MADLQVVLLEPDQEQDSVHLIHQQRSSPMVSFVKDQRSTAD